MLLTKEAFMDKLSQIIRDQNKGKGHTIRLVFKRYIDGSKRWKGKSEEPDVKVIYCLVRTKIGNIKISTKIDSNSIDKFRENLSKIIDSIN